MRRSFLALSLALGVASMQPALAAPYGYADAQRDFEGNLDAKARQILQVWLIMGGYTNGVPTDHFNTRTFKALQQFQAENGFAPTGRLDKPQVDRLVAVIDPKVTTWGLRPVTFPGREAKIWVPFGLDLEAKANGSGLHYKDRQGRLSLDFVSVPDRTLEGVYRGLVADKQRDGSSLHYSAVREAEGWFVLSSTSLDGSDHYYRYHQDGGAVTGFALEWQNTAGNVNAERIAVLESAVLGASMKGDGFIDPPGTSAGTNAAPPPPPAQQAAVPVTPAPKPVPKDAWTSGTGFFVTDEGHFVTNAHVVAECTKIRVKMDDGAVVDADKLALDPQNDLALLRLKATPARVASLRIGGRLGEGVEAFGFPHSDLLSTSGNFTLGNITAMNGMHDDSRYLQVSAPVQAGNSGGPLLDQSGNLVGVVSAKLDAIKVAMASDDLPQNVNFAVKSAMVAAFLDANRVAYQTGAPAKTPLQPADIAEQARAMSGFVLCK